MYHCAFFSKKDTETAVIIGFIFISCIMIPKYPVLQHTQRVLKVLYLWRNYFWRCFVFGFTNIGNEILKHTSFGHIAVRVEKTSKIHITMFMGMDINQPILCMESQARILLEKALENSARKYGYLTQADNDYIFSQMIEETGIFGLFGLVIL